MTFLKWLAGLLLTLSMLILAAIIVVPMVIDPNDYRDEITSLVKKKTGRDLVLNGNLEVSVFPWLGIRTQGLSFSQPEKIGGEMVSVDTAQLQVKLMPLFSKKVEVDTVVLEQPQIRLVTLKDGSDSFTGLTGDASTEKAASDKSAGAAVAIVIQGLELTDGTIVIEDRQAGSRTEIRNMNLVTDNLIGDTLESFDASGQYIDADNPSPLNFDVEGRAKIDTETLKVLLADVEADLAQNDSSMNATVEAVTMLPNQDIDLTGLVARVQGPQPLELEVPTISVSSEFQKISFGAIDVRSGDLNAVVKNLVATNINDVLKATGDLSVAEFDAVKLLKDYEIDFTPTDRSALRAVAVDTNFTAGLDEVALSNLKLKLDESSLRGSAAIRNFEQPAVKFDLNLDTLNLDNYLPVDEGGDSSESVSSGQALAVPMAIFHRLNANGRFKAAQFVSGGIELTDIDVVVKSSNGNVEIVPAAKLYDGELAGKFAYQQRDGQAQLKVNQKVDLVKLGPLLNAADVSDQLSGLGSLGIDVVVTEKNGVQSNSGTIKLFAKDGALSGLDINGLMDRANLLMGLYEGGGDQASTAGTSAEVTADKSDFTEYGELIGTFNLNDNVLSNNDLKIEAPGLTVTGFGDIFVDTQSLDYNLRVTIGNGLRGALAERLGRLSGYEIPIRCRGTLEGIPCKLDTSALFSSFTQNKIDKKKEDFLQDKYGIEDGGKLSTKDAIKQILIQKATGKDKEEKNRERPIGERDAPVDAESNKSGDSGSYERPIEDVPANPDQPVEPQKSDKEQLKDELKENLKRRLLEGLFN